MSASNCTSAPCGVVVFSHRQGARAALFATGLACTTWLGACSFGVASPPVDSGTVSVEPDDNPGRFVDGGQRKTDGGGQDGGELDADSGNVNSVIDSGSDVSGVDAGIVDSGSDVSGVDAGRDVEIVDGGIVDGGSPADGGGPYNVDVEACLQEVRVVQLLSGRPKLQAFRRSVFGWEAFLPDGYDVDNRPRQSSPSHLSHNSDGFLIAGTYGIQGASDDNFALRELRGDSSLPSAGTQVTNDSVAAKLGNRWIHAGHGIRIFDPANADDDVEEFSATGNARFYTSTTGVQSVLGDEVVFFAHQQGMSWIRGGNPTQVVDVSSDDLRTYADHLRGMVWDEVRQVLWLAGEGVVHRLAFPEPLLTLQTFEISTLAGDAQPAVMILHHDELHLFYDASDGDRWVVADVADGTPIFSAPLRWGDSDSSSHWVRAAQIVCDTQLLLTVQGSRQALRIFDLEQKTLTQTLPAVDGFTSAKSMVVSTREAFGIAGDSP